MPKVFQSIQIEISEFKNNLKTKIFNNSDELSEIREHLFSNHGKLIRPSIIITLSKAINNTGHKHTETLAMVTELMHMASLIHDDLIDQAELRRGITTIHTEWSAKHAVISGDYLFAYSTKLLNQINNSQISEVYAELLIELCKGEIQQANQRYKVDKEILNWDNYLLKSKRKTAAMFSAATQSTAILHQLSGEMTEQLRLFGENIGLAFQIIDDLIDFSSSEETLGKPALADMQNGIYTAPILYALESSDELLDLLAPEPNITAIQEILTTTNALKQTKALAEDYIEKAKQNLQDLSESEYKNDLLELADYIVERNY